MGLLRGSVTPDAIYRGPIAVDKVYRGTVEVWSAYVAPTYDLQNTFAGGSDGVTITTANSGGASGDAWDVVSGTPKYDTGDVPPGSTVASLHPATGYGYLSWTSLSGRKAAIRFWFKPTADVSSDQRLLRINSTGDNWGLLYRSGGLVRLMIGSSGANENIPVNVNEWNEVILTIDGETKAYTIAAFAADGTELGSSTDTSAAVAGDFDYLRLGGQLSSANFGGPYSIGDVRFNLDDTLAPPVKPGASNTGTVGTLTPSVGDYYADSEGAVIENLDITGIIHVRVANLTIRNCRVRGAGAGTSGSGLINCARETVTGTIIIEDCELAPDTPSIDWNGVVGHNFTARRNNIHSVVDGFGVWNLFATTASAQVTIEYNYVHDSHCWTPDPNHGDNRTHNDGVQIHTGGGVTITGNNFDWTPGATSEPTLTNTYACLMLNGDGQLNPVTVSDNWLTGGSAIINGADTGPTYTLNITGNRFTNPDAGYFMLLATQHTCPGLPTSTGPDTNNGNVLDSDDTPVTVHRQ